MTQAVLGEIYHGGRLGDKSRRAMDVVKGIVKSAGDSRMRKRLCWSGGIWLIVLSVQFFAMVGCGPSLQLRVKANDRYRLAQQYLGTQSYLLAEEQVRKALALSPDNPSYFELLALIYQAQDRIRLADEAYRAAFQKDDVPPSILVNYSTLLLMRELPDEAITMARQALQNPGYSKPALAHTNIGLAYLKKGVLLRAEEHFRTALEYQPALPEAHHNLGLVYTRSGKQFKAMLSFREAIRAWPAYTEAHASLGELLLQEGRADEARGAFERVIALEPDSELAVVSRQHLRQLSP